MILFLLSGCLFIASKAHAIILPSQIPTHKPASHIDKPTQIAASGSIVVESSI
jgi:hypothetical protein